MAKIRHNNFLDTVVQVMTNAKEQGALHLYAEGLGYTGRKVRISGKELFHFGTTGYLGLEQDTRLKKAAIKAIENYGTQFPLSKTYISHPLYAELEEKISSMYSLPAVITKNSTLGHMGIIPSIVEDSDAIILDHQVHWSVQSACQPLKLRSVPVEMIRHNRLDMLEDKIRKFRDKYNRIWYMADGMYSMYGDFAPLEELLQLSAKYPQLHLYMDDVHGMSWKGIHGTGYVMSVLKKLPENMILVGTLSKTFGASGAIMVTSNDRIYQRVKNFGGPLTFSVQLEPASVAAAIASAKIHLSEEIYQLQFELGERISLLNLELKNTALPLLYENDSPVFYIGTGMPETGFNLVNRLKGEGYYVNLGIFPAVPVKNTGLRITVSRHNQPKEIKGLAQALKHHYYKALEDTHTNVNRVKFAFGVITNREKENKHLDSKLKIEAYRSIQKIDRPIWNDHVGKRGLLDWEGMQFLEKSFTGNQLPEHNYKFFYFFIKDPKNKVVLVSFFTYSLWKEDMLAPVSVTKKIEKERETNPYYRTSYILSMGSFLTEGEHLYLNRDSEFWQSAFRLMLNEIEALEKQLKPSAILLRDFNISDQQIHEFLHNKGFVKVTMPDSAVYNLSGWEGEEEYLKTLSTRSRRHFRKEIIPYTEKFKITIEPEVAPQLLNIFYELYLEVKGNNPGLNTFDYPKTLFENMNTSKNWEFIVLRLIEIEKLPVVGVMFCYKNSSLAYVPNLVGMDYRYSRDYQVYRQLLYQTIRRARELNFKRIDFGLTAAFEKRKVGACIQSKCAYLQTADNYTMESLDWLRTD